MGLISHPFQIETGEIEVGSSNKVKVKISGDGAKMTRQTNFLVITFSIVDSDDVMSSKGNLTPKHKFK